MPRRGLARKADGTPTRKTQRNFTDPDTHLMQSGGLYLQGYNCQLAPESRQVVEIPWGLSPGVAGAEHALLKRQSLQGVGRPASLV
jgi:hypothetical protein